MRLINLVGQTFNRITVISRASTKDPCGKVKWNCVCSCGTFLICTGGNLNFGTTKSCGCTRNEKTIKRNTKHGLSYHPLYSTWLGMRDRCNNINHLKFSSYGGRGIAVCKEWGSFETFLNDMGEKPSKEYSIERVNNSLGYSPENCIWALPIQQGNNTRANRIISYKGTSRTVAQWARIISMNRFTLYNRIFIYNWPIEKALMTPVKLKHN